MLGPVVGPANIVIVLAVLAFILYRQVVPRATSPRRLFLPPFVLLVIGIVNLSKVHHGHFSDTASGYLAADLVASAVLGAARGWSVRLFRRDGVLWRQGGAVTIALWLLTIGVRVVIGLLATHAGVGKVSNAALLASLGLTLASQSAVVAWRGARLGIPWAPSTPRSA